MLRQYALTYKDLAVKIADLEHKYNKSFSDVYEALNLLLEDKQTQSDWEKRKQIGYKI